ncbi:MATE family efflux transporter [Hymenobacter bucti]|uniref:Multidrug-efflux transporter n=1 Tax=Hymenobacter bucti TaxID=1844114 RepID=A0ABW4QVP5_9BACT
MPPTPAARPNLTQGPILQSLLKLAWPIVFGNVLQTGYQLVDAFWVGRLGAKAVAAVAVSFPVNFLLIALGSGFSVAGSVLVAQNFGARHQKMVNHVASQALVLETVLALLLTVGAHFASPYILHLMGAGPDIFEPANQFQRVLFWGLTFNFGFLMFQALMRGVGEVKIPLYINLVTLGLNFVLDPLFIYGWGPVPGLGVAGSAMATIITQALSVVAGLAVLLRGRSGIQLSFAGFRPDWALMGRVFRLGAPSSVDLSARALGLSVLTTLAAGFGTSVLATYGIGSRIIALAIIPALGISLACSTLVAQNVGARNLPRALQTANYALGVSFTTLLVLSGIIWLAARPLVGFFLKGDPLVSEQSVEFVRIASLSLCFTGVQQTVSGAFRGVGNTLSAMVLTITGIWVFQFPVAWYLSHHTDLGFRGIWWSFVVANVGISLIAGLWYWKGNWHGQHQADPLGPQVAAAAPQEEKAA